MGPMQTDHLIEQLRREFPGAVHIDDGGAAILPRSSHELGRALAIATRLGVRLVAPGGYAEPGGEHGRNDGADRNDGARRDGGDPARSRTSAVPSEPPALPVDLRNLSDLLGVDEVSLIAHVGAGATLAEAERELGRHALTLGWLPPEHRDTSIGAWLAGGAKGGRSHDDDPVDQLVAGLEARLHDGREVRLRPAPRRAVGPDLIRAFVGGHGRFGIITAAHLVVRLCTEIEDVAFSFATDEDAMVALAQIRGAGIRPLHSHIVASPARLWMRMDGQPAVRRACRSVARDLAAARGGVEIPVGEFDSTIN